jgi:hypothetical protein
VRVQVPPRFARGTAHGFGSPCPQGEPEGADKGTSVRHRIAAAGAIFPSGCVGRQARRVALTPCVPLLKGVGFLRACLLAEPPNRVFLSPCGRDARVPSTRDAGSAGVPPAMPTAREKTYPFKVSPSPAGRAGEGERAAPLSHQVGEGLGVRAKKRVCSPRSEPKCCTLIRPEGGGGRLSTPAASPQSARWAACSAASAALRASAQPAATTRLRAYAR